MSPLRTAHAVGLGGGRGLQSAPVSILMAKRPQTILDYHIRATTEKGAVGPQGFEDFGREMPACLYMSH